jgi:flagellar hook-length control protein FliK
VEQDAPTLPAAPVPGATAAAAHTGTPASLAAQLAPALLTLARTADGSHQITVRLQPAELGMVQVRIATAVSGTTQIEITAENPTTLQALQRDQPQLHRTLDQAGIPTEGRTVTFHVAQAAQVASVSSGAQSSTGHTGGQGNTPGRSSAGTNDPDSSAGGGRGSYAARERTPYPTARRPSPPSTPAGATAAAAAASNRIGLDITA